MTGVVVVSGEPTGPVETQAPVTPPEVVMSDASLTAEIVIDGLDQPTAIGFIDDAVLVTEKATGKVRIVRDGVAVADAIDLAVNNFDERGLLGIAVHPEFPAEPFVYLHWTWRGGGGGDDALLGDDSDVPTEVPELGNRVDRFRWDDDALAFDRNIVEFRSNTLDSDTSGRVRGNHDAGPLTFGPDGKLYTMIGDLAFEPTSGLLWHTENGDDSYDEINVFPAGSNSGWIQLQGPVDRFGEYQQLEADSADGFDMPSWPPDNLAADAAGAEQAMVHLPGSSFVPPVLSFVHPPALTAVGFTDRSAGSDERQRRLVRHRVERLVAALPDCGGRQVIGPERVARRRRGRQHSEG